MNITIKNIPEAVYKEFKQAAQTQGRSLNAQLVHVLSVEAAEVERRRQMRASRKDLDRFVAGLPKMNSSVRLVREDREGR